MFTTVDNTKIYTCSN